jgi:hypothetical protein
MPPAGQPGVAPGTQPMPPAGYQPGGQGTQPTNGSQPMPPAGQPGVAPGTQPMPPAGYQPGGQGTQPMPPAGQPGVSPGTKPTNGSQPTPPAGQPMPGAPTNQQMSPMNANQPSTSGQQGSSVQINQAPPAVQLCFCYLPNKADSTGELLVPNDSSTISAVKNGATLPANVSSAIQKLKKADFVKNANGSIGIAKNTIAVPACQISQPTPPAGSQTNKK